MSYFQSSKQLEEVLVGFFEALLADPEVGSKLRASKLKIQFVYSEPPLSISVDLQSDPAVISVNNESFQPEVQMKMKADTAHRFWFGKINLIAALTRREMVAKGPIPKILKLLPAIKPAYAMYPGYLKKRGWDDLLI
jgi:hypothetical protein